VKICQIVGARPQFVKLGPVSRRIAWLRQHAGASVEESVLHTGQHYDPLMSDRFFDELELPTATANLGVGSGPHGRQTAAMLERIEQYLQESVPDVVVVYGDTNSTLAGALAAAKLHIPVAHVEAGLRSGNRRMPEEVNRIATDHMADLLLVPTLTGMRNLAAESLAARSVLTGDVMYDAVLHHREQAAARASVSARLGMATDELAVATIHRAENTTPERLSDVLQALNRVAATVLPTLFLVHPRTAQVLQRDLAGWRPHPRLQLAEPVGYLDMLQLLGSARVVLTDSGGLQKEALFMGCPCVTLREESEWPETIEAGGNRLAGSDPERVLAAVTRALDTHGRGGAVSLAARCRQSFGSGNSAHSIVDQLMRLGTHGA
jgi:UDP-N-acetylglucosamine 2-epimerase